VSIDYYLKVSLHFSFSFRFTDMFPDKELVRGIQAELDQTIHAGVQNIVKLVHRTNRLDDARDVAVTTSTTEKTAEAVAALSKESKSTNGTISNATQIRSIIGLEEELDIDTTSSPSTAAVEDIKTEQQQKEKPATPLAMTTHKVLHSYLNALKTQAETRGHEFNETEDLIKQLISKDLLSQRSVDKLEKQLATYNNNEKRISKKRDTTKTTTSSAANKKSKRK
jgi:hypothetical protein